MNIPTATSSIRKSCSNVEEIRGDMCWRVELVVDTGAYPAGTQIQNTALGAGIRLAVAEDCCVAYYSVSAASMHDAVGEAESRWDNLTVLFGSTEWTVLDLRVHRVDPNAALRMLHLAVSD